MQKAVIISEKDKAGLNIKQRLLERYDFKKKDNVYYYEDISIHTFDKEAVYLDNIDKKIKADLFIFATKHSSKSEIPSLSIHCAGNWGKAELGGKDKELCYSPTKLIQQGYFLLKRYKEKNNLYHEVVIEATHHGPFIKKPMLFIEIGSTEEEWIKKEAGEIIADVIVELSKIKFSENDECFIGIGGLHTCPNFIKIIENLAPGHICPKYMLDTFDEKSLNQAIERSIGKVKYIILDWKGLGEYKQKIKDITSKCGIEVKKTSDF